MQNLACPMHLGCASPKFGSPTIHVAMRQERTVEFSIRRKIDMAGRVRDFCRTHPDPTNPGYTAAVAKLEELLIRADVLSQQQVSGHLTVAGAVASVQDVRDQIKNSIDLLAGLARAASREEPELKAGITRVPMNGSQQEFLTQARVAASTANAHRDLLVRFGLPEGLLEQLGQMLDGFEQAINDRRAGRLAHVGAHADLAAVDRDIMDRIHQIDAITRYRYRNEAEPLAAWKSARNVAWPLPPEPEKETPAAGSADKPAA
jgi:hypothetical protein